jgi:hypothetical protein
LTSVFATVDIYPQELQVKAKLKLKYKNTTNAAISEILMHFPKQKYAMSLSIRRFPQKTKKVAA